MKINWQFGNRKILTKYNGFHTIDKDVIYLCGGNYQNATLYAIDAHSGREKWFFNSNSIDNDIFTSPTIYKQNIYLVSVRGKLFSLDFSTGHLNWEIKIDTSQTSFPLTSSPITVHEIIYVGSNNGYLYAFDTNTGKELWKYEAPTSEIFFREPKNLISAIANELGKVFIDNPFSEFLSPIVINNLIYVVVKNGNYQSLLSLTIN